MALEQTPTHPDADSYVTVNEADAYLAGHPDESEWTNLWGTEKESRLKMATRHVDSFRFKSYPVVYRSMHYRNKQALKFPRQFSPDFSHLNVKSGNADSATSNGITDSSFADREDLPDDYWKDGAVIITEGTGKGQTREVTGFDASTGEITVGASWTTTPDDTSDFLLTQDVPKAIKYATIEQAIFITRGDYKNVQQMMQGLQQYRIGDLSETYGAAGVSLTPMGTPFSSEAMGYISAYISRLGRIV